MSLIVAMLSVAIVVASRVEVHRAFAARAHTDHKLLVREPDRERGIRSPPVDRARFDAWMSLALEEARAAPEHDDVPVGAVVVRLSDGEVLARRHNERERVADPTAHAEILAVRDASAKVGSWRLDGCALVVTLEPCPMCAGAALASRVDAVVFGAADPKAGACGSLYNVTADPRLNHEAEVIDGVRADESAALLREFFAARRRASEL
jgi:tRNA(adenine34) deaminase